MPDGGTCVFCRHFSWKTGNQSPILLHFKRNNVECGSMACCRRVRSINTRKQEREEKEQAWNGAGRAHTTCTACHSVDEWVLGAFLLWTALPSFFSPSPFSSSCLRRPVDVYERLSWQIKYSLEMPPSIGDLIRERGYVRVFTSTNSLSQRTSFNYI